jgi:hypothetical protein
MVKTLKGENWYKQFDEVSKLVTPSDQKDDHLLLYSVYAVERPEDDKEGSKPEQFQHIANIRLTEKLTLSAVADRQLYFQHVRFDDDLAIKTDWDPVKPPITFF